MWRVVSTADTAGNEIRTSSTFSTEHVFYQQFLASHSDGSFQTRKCKFLTMQIENMPQLINRVTPNSRKLTPRKSITTLCGGGVGEGWNIGKESPLHAVQ